MVWMKFPEYPENWNEISRMVKERDGRRCVRCGAKSTPGNRLHAHHIISKSKGGTDNLNNLETLCENCHSEEHPHMKEYFHYTPRYSSQDYLEKIREEQKMKDTPLSVKYRADSEYCSNCHKNTRQSVKIEDGVKTYFCFECYQSIKEEIPKKIKEEIPEKKWRIEEKDKLNFAKRSFRKFKQIFRKFIAIIKNHLLQ